MNQSYNNGDGTYSIEELMQIQDRENHPNGMYELSKRIMPEDNALLDCVNAFKQVQENFKYRD